jgi:hypothetical protein
VRASIDVKTGEIYLTQGALIAPFRARVPPEPPQKPRQTPSLSISALSSCPADGSFLVKFFRIIDFSTVSQYVMAYIITQKGTVFCLDLAIRIAQS